MDLQQLCDIPVNNDISPNDENLCKKRVTKKALVRWIEKGRLGRHSTISCLHLFNHDSTIFDKLHSENEIEFKLKEGKKAKPVDSEELEEGKIYVGKWVEKKMASYFACSVQKKSGKIHFNFVCGHMATADVRQPWTNPQDCYFEYLIIRFDYLIIRFDYLIIG